MLNCSKSQFQKAAFFLLIYPRFPAKRKISFFLIDPIATLRYNKVNVLHFKFVYLFLTLTTHGRLYKCL